MITASAGANGSVSPSGTVFAQTGANKTFTFTPSVGYAVEDVLVDGVSVGHPAFYTFTSVHAPHTLSVSFGLETTVNADLLCSMVVSGYKWLTSTLQTAQQQYAVRPYFKAKIVNDSVTPSQSISTSASATRYNGNMVTAPDGNVLAVGEDTSGNVVFYKGANLHSGSFDTSVTLQIGGGTHSGNLQQRYCIKVSDWILGSYHIDVWYFFNFGSDGTQIKVQHYYSDNGGTSWNSESITALSGVPNTNFPTYNLSLAGITPRWNPVTQTVQTGFMYIYASKDGHGTLNTYGTAGYQAYNVQLFFGDVSNGYTASDWPSDNANGDDWTVHSLDTYRLGTVDHVVISGFRNFFDSANQSAKNYSIWDFSIESISDSPEVWSSPTSLFSAAAAISSNANAFTYPVATVANQTINGVPYPTAQITFNALTTSAVATDGTTTATDVMLVQSVDGLNFTYPSIFTLSGSAVGFIPFGASYVPQGAYYYLFAFYSTNIPLVWEFNNNNIVADVSNDVLTYTIQEVAGQPASIALQIANQNNIWVGSAPTNPGASAIAGGKKILIEQGYYNANSVTETVPRNVFFIDDIQQNSTSSDNSVTISGRDLFRSLSLAITKYAYNIFNSLFVVDTFTGTSLANWNQQSGSWQETGGAIQTTTAPVSDAVITLANMPPNSYGSIMTVSIQGNTVGHMYIYLVYLDSTHWARLNYTFGTGSSCSYALEVSSYHQGFGPSFSFIYSGSDIQLNDPTKYYPIIVRQHDYTKFEIIASTGDTLSNSGNDMNSFGGGATLTLFGGGVEIDLTSIGGTFPNLLTDWGGATQPAATNQWAVGFGCNGVQQNFKYFRYVQYYNSLNLAEIIKNIATKAGVFVYKTANVFTDYFYGFLSYVTTAAAIVNRRMVISPNGNAFNADTPISDGEITSTIAVVPGAATYDFAIAFRIDATGPPANAYRFHVFNNSGFVRVVLERLYQGVWKTFAPGTYNCTGNPQLGNLNIDLTLPHKYRLVFVNAWMFFYIDGVEVCGWNDNNTTSPYLTTGYWGWYTGSDTSIVVQQVTSTAFWKQNPSLSLNPGDDMLSTLSNYLLSVRAWFFGDLFGRLKSVFLSSTDASTYTYQNQIYMSGVNSSNKEFVSQITVYGANGVTATARNNNLMSGVPVREMVVVDYTITTQQDAQTRANQELTNANQYQSQVNPKMVMNVGAELFDAVTITDTGNNSTGVNSGTRVYSEKFTLGSSNNEYSLEVDTGNL